ncbi:MAG: 1-acyl-sn-glycerol-3-phosphate acyltransferase [Myxococcota bacterium]|nr:1-acyl-sn-glycerol-3-phosphate acyltransferase [Myxococcota bacterium]
MGLGRFGRRALTVPAFLLLAAGGVVLAPLWLPSLAIVDLVRGGNWRSLRCGSFFAFFFLCETVGILASFGIWLGNGVGRSAARERFLRDNFRLQCWWARTLYRGAARIFSFTTEVDGQEAAERTPFLLFLRHAAVADTLLAAVFVSDPFGVRLRYVLKRELLWDPCLDIVGNRLPNHFVDRTPEDRGVEIDELARLADGLENGEGVLIYPEGTRFTEAKRTRALARLRERGPAEMARRAEGLVRVLPPRPGGPLALVERAPQADVVFCAHAGFEGAGNFRDLWAGSLVGKHMRVRFWRVPAAEIPEAPGERLDWLFDQWEAIDRWLAEVAG